MGGLKLTSFARAGVALVTVKSTSPFLMALTTSATRWNVTYSTGTCSRLANSAPRS
jgi:hypothetical protein